MAQLNLPRETRRHLAGALRQSNHALAEELSVRLATEPDPVPIEIIHSDVQAHLNILATAVEVGSIPAFAQHMSWTTTVLETRNLSRRMVVRTIEELDRALTHRFPEAAPVLAAYLRSARQACETAGTGTQPNIASWANWKLRNMFLKAILEGDRRDALSVCFEAMSKGQPLVNIYEEIVQDALYEVGRLWQTNKITVADEHMASMVVQCVLAEVFAKTPLPAPARPGVVVASVQDEHHNFGPQMVADALTEAGWRVRYLGGNLPIRDLLRAIEKHQPEVICLSATMLSNITRAEEAIRQIQQGFGSATPWIVVGGQAFLRAPEFWKEAGADGCVHTLTEIRETLNVLSMRTPARNAASTRLQ